MEDLALGLDVGVITWVFLVSALKACLGRFVENRIIDTGFSSDSIPEPLNRITTMVIVIMAIIVTHFRCAITWNGRGQWYAR
jgi:hypothetical protein